MRRARLRMALIAVVLLLLGGIGFLIGRTMLQQRRSAEELAQGGTDPDVAQSIRKFRRVKVEQGRTVWDLRADQADFLDEGMVRVDAPELAFFSDDGRSVRLSGLRGRVVLEGQEVARIDLSGGIEAGLGRYRLVTPSASWLGKRNKVFAHHGVEFRGDGIEIDGQTMVVDLARRRAVFMGNVRTVFQRSGPAVGAAPDRGGRRAP